MQRAEQAACYGSGDRRDPHMSIIREKEGARSTTRPHRKSVIGGLLFLLAHTTNLFACTAYVKFVVGAVDSRTA